MTEEPQSQQAADPQSTADMLRDRLHQMTGRLSVMDGLAIGLSLLWLLGVSLFFLILPQGDGTEGGGLRGLMTVLAIALPIGMIWIAVLSARSVQVLREESQRLRAMVDAMGQNMPAAPPPPAAARSEPQLERKLDDIARMAQKTEAALATIATQQVVAPALTAGMAAVPTDATPVSSPSPNPSSDPTPVPGPVLSRVSVATEDQPSLALETPADHQAPQISKPDLVRALNFPDTAGDRAGFAALRRALKDRGVKPVIQASQDVLTLLSQDGIYMDDLQIVRAAPEVWRRFAQGERGPEVKALGNVQDEASLAVTIARMKEDTIFRDSAHHFLRKYDQMLVEFETGASDADLAALAETRTSRAFVLMGSATGSFD